MEKYQFKFINYQKAYLLLDKRVKILQTDPTNDFYQAGIIQTFEFTFELAWKFLRSFMEYKGLEVTTFPRDIIKLAFQNNLVQNGEIWLQALESRNKTSHNGDFASLLTKQITEDYLPLFEKLYTQIYE
jgi:nucleotidyltransferase substrate binding protein (TIGR01987 family)